MTGKREDAVQSAVRFLKDPKVVASPLARKIAFLESKGLSSAEIEEAVSKSTVAGTATSAAATASTGTVNASDPHNYSALPPPMPSSYGQPMPYYGQPAAAQAPYYGSTHGLPPHMMPQQGWGSHHSGWKDYFIASVVAIGASYGMFQLLKTYVGPLVAWPTDQKLEIERTRIDEQLASASSAIAAVKDETEHVLHAMESRATKVNSSLDTMHTLLSDLRDFDDKRDADLKVLRDDMENIKTLLPKMLDKTKEVQSSVLTDLQTEIKSLKNLLLNRRLGGASLPGTPTNDENNAAAPPPITSTTAAPLARSMAVKPSIPSWQLEPAQGTAEKKTSPADGDGSGATA
ncbi:hypothetical protein SeMB42_g04824 [Synchytrium endobioticum]|uniref:Peroxisomal membrane protein PEX14 n=1 Tax=Synchytrium endobioticum TaxID=286115 RepID=A0A507CVJ7_9FUNG|nr:hypothetical protein SeMB42_g04824 [Synchytrium endobioticum]TPX45890.1 hypothetical protein SeLEV6574_g03572 [Synchytrium endobioticum]